MPVAAHGPSGAPPVAREFVTLSGTGTTSVTVRFDRRVDFLAGKDFSGEFYRPHISVSGARVRGFAILPAGSDVNALSVFGLRVPSGKGTRSLLWPVGGSGDTFAFSPGTYRLVLLADGPGSVRFRLPGLRAGNVGLRASAPVRARLGGAATPDGGTPHYAATDTYAARRAARILTYLWYAGPVTAATRSVDCYYRGAVPTAGLPGCVGGESSAAIVNATPRQDVDSYGVGTSVVPPGTWTVRSEVTSVGVIESAGASFVWIEV